MIKSVLVVSIVSGILAVGPYTEVSAPEPVVDTAKGRYFDVSGDGRLVIFETTLMLSPADTDPFLDVYLHDRHTGETRMLNVRPDGSESSGIALSPAISANGGYAVFYTSASDLGPPDANGDIDAYWLDLASGEFRLVSVDTDGVDAGNLPDGSARALPRISADGSSVVFVSPGSSLPGETDNSGGVFVYHVGTGTTERVTVSTDGDTGGGGQPHISHNGRYVAFKSSSTNLVDGDTNGQTDVFVRDLDAGTTVRASTILSDGQLYSEAISEYGVPVVTEDGRYVLFSATTPEDGTQLYRKDLVTGSLVLFTTSIDGEPSNHASLSYGTASSNGVVAIRSYASDLVEVDFNETMDVFVASLSDFSGFRRVSELPGGYGGDDWSYLPRISANGRHVLFYSEADNLGDTSLGRVFGVALGGPFADVDEGALAENEITWLREEGITRGCDWDLYCPGDPVTRGQMASFISRTLNLPAASDDFFADDNSSSHEGSINALREAGITFGCSSDGDSFCPDDLVTRAQMASFLARALELDPSEAGFSDDDGSVHELNIGAIAAAGITVGCDADRPDLFCPDAEVTRRQMAAFLYRSQH